MKNAEKYTEELDSMGLFLFTGAEIIETLEDDYEIYDATISFDEWIKPVVVNNLDMQELYITNGDISFEPVPLHKWIAERELQNQSVDAAKIEEYLSNVLVLTESYDQIVESDFSIYVFDDIEDYLGIETIESFDNAHRKLDNHGVEPSERFVEVAYDGREFYINTYKLSSERDILDFLNDTFSEVQKNVVAVSFNRELIN